MARDNKQPPKNDSRQTRPAEPPAVPAARQPVRCFVLMQFTQVMTLAYSHAILRAIQEINQGDELNGLTLKCDRADQIYEPRFQKVEAIIEELKNSDLVIVDVTSYNPNVMWELGLCHALNKPAIRIRAENLHQGPDQLPFNIQGLDLIKYEVSTDGLEKLTEKLKTRIREQIANVRSLRNSLQGDADIRSRYELIRDDLGRIRGNSILRELAKREMDRLQTRMHGLTRGEFDLRNKKEPNEVTRYYCDYLNQLDGPHCQFLTITHFRFWKAITVDGTDLRMYLNKNEEVARRGTVIRRVFLVEEPHELSARDLELRDTVLEHLKDAAEDTLPCECKVIVGDRARLNRYMNFGLLVKGDESLLFQPEYDPVLGGMTRTRFYYSREEHGQLVGMPEHVKLIADIRGQFDRAWSNGVPVTRHLQKPTG